MSSNFTSGPSMSTILQSPPSLFRYGRSSSRTSPRPKTAPSKWTNSGQNGHPNSDVNDVRIQTWMNRYGSMCDIESFLSVISTTGHICTLGLLDIVPGQGQLWLLRFAVGLCFFLRFHLHFRFLASRNLCSMRHRTPHSLSVSLFDRNETIFTDIHRFKCLHPEPFPPPQKAKQPWSAQP